MTSAGYVAVWFFYYGIISIISGYLGLVSARRRTLPGRALVPVDIHPLTLFLTLVEKKLTGRISINFG